MQIKKLLLVTFTSLFFIALRAQEEKLNYIEFDDRKNVVHGVYFGFDLHYSRLGSKNAVFGSVKLAYVANQKLEIGFEGRGFSGGEEDINLELIDEDELYLLGGYFGMHVEPILFGKRFISVSFPLLIGGGVVGYADYDVLTETEFDDFFVVEPGINILYNFSRFTQLETGVRYRFTSEYDLLPYGKGNLNGFSVGAGLKIGIFNMGRKKKIKSNF